jgi:hypothetical protein
VVETSRHGMSGSGHTQLNGASPGLPWWQPNMPFSG